MAALMLSASARQKLIIELAAGFAESMITNGDLAEFTQEYIADESYKMAEKFIAEGARRGYITG